MGDWRSIVVSYITKNLFLQYLPLVHLWKMVYLKIIILIFEHFFLYPYQNGCPTPIISRVLTSDIFFVIRDWRGTAKFYLFSSSNFCLLLAQLLIWCEMEVIYSKRNYKVKARKTHPWVSHLGAIQKLCQPSFGLGSLTYFYLLSRRGDPNKREG